MQAIVRRLRRHGGLRRLCSHAAPPKDSAKFDAQALISRHKASFNKWGYVTIGLGGLCLVAFAPELKNSMSKTTAEVASETLQNEMLQIQTQELASQIVQTVLNDPKVLHQASQFIKNLSETETTQKALVVLTSNVLNNPQTMAQVTKLSKQLLLNLMQDPGTMRQFVNLIKNAIADPATRESVISLLEKLMQDEPTKERLTKLVAHTFVQEPVKRSVTSTITSSLHGVMSNPDIQDHAKQFIGGVVRDETVQSQSGDALWNTMTYVLTPRWVSWFWHGEDGPPPSGDAAPPTREPHFAKS
ncbi:hypothetical protein SPRG_20104 [Saprolegnia parasitica CBS 223.65]|uniref:Uncharacterized protein n=1 Tax=Saprolegnia parasitica (strain CBS 223.65) TaxID=695850 RepID=A0A067CE05_SAPPC|nr:hypothetical protein SPRG_20104 [Saprolegnia parasitica CBS 223.65]KDO28999.1 hypothetical protein SPRG_20104 [Saprolegnia parasitica CBS 223.65]|eukprot:XP_012200328.1 hypothetical protein SPRG_20104 [Saprolegnia parasitica CBS 223.65]